MKDISDVMKTNATRRTSQQQQLEEEEAPSGFSLTHNVVPVKLWDEIQEWLDLDWDKDDLGLSCSASISNDKDHIPWEMSTVEQNRPVAQFGFRYNYVCDVVDTTTACPPIPAVLSKLIALQGDESLSLLPFTQCIINAYGPNATSHIPWHKDDWRFGPIVLVYTFGSARPLQMRRQQSHGNDALSSYNYYTAYPRHLSCYILAGFARYDWEHMVPTGSEWRVSITFRSWGNNNKVASDGSFDRRNDFV